MGAAEPNGDPPNTPQGRLSALTLAVASLVLTLLALSAFLLIFVIVGLAGDRWLSATDTSEGHSLFLPVVTALVHVALIIGVVLLGKRSKRS